MATITDSKKPGGPKGKNADSKGDKESEGGKGGGKKMLLMLLAGVLVTLAAVGGAYVLFLKEPGPPAPPAPGAMVQMDAQTLSLADKHFLKIQIAVQLVDGKATAETFETVKASQLLIDTFSNLPVDELSSNAARKDLTAQLLTGLHEAYPEEVYDVFLTQFVIQ